MSQHLFRFETWNDFVSTAADRSRRVWHRHEVSRERCEPGGHRGTETFEEAVDLAINSGWPEGLERLTRVSFEAARQWVAPVPCEVYDVAGAYPLPPLAAAGDPAAMVDVGSTLVATNPIVRLLVPLSCSSSVSMTEIVNNGAAILSVVDALETSGRSVEVSCQSGGVTSTDRVDFVAVFKTAGQALDLERAAFALMNPAVHRRFSFSLMEQCPVEASFSGAYGMPTTPTDEMVDGMIVMPPPDHASTSVERCVERAVAALGELGDLDIAWGLPTTFRVDH